MKRIHRYCEFGGFDYIQRDDIDNRMSIKRFGFEDNFKVPKPKDIIKRDGIIEGLLIDNPCKIYPEFKRVIEKNLDILNLQDEWIVFLRKTRLEEDDRDVYFENIQALTYGLHGSQAIITKITVN